MTLEQTQFMADNPHLHSATPLSDGSLLVRTGTGNSMTKITTQMLQGNSYKHQAYDKSKRDNPNLMGANQSGSDSIHNIEPAKIKSMAKAIADSEGRTVDLDKAVAEVKSNPKYLTELTSRYSQAVDKMAVTESALRESQMEASRHGDLNAHHRESLNAESKLPSEM